MGRDDDRRQESALSLKNLASRRLVRIGETFQWLVAER